MRTALRQLLTSTAQHLAYTDQRDAYGKPVFGPPIARSYRDEAIDRRVPGPNGEEVLVTGRLFLDGDGPIPTSDDLIILEDGRTAKPLQVNTVQDATGAGLHHVEVLF